ncbi:MAG TPA: hypothetical protein VHR86_02420 [Armatimonadota bacterium]|nr:hypothetical protein [Armatimonadota bacterium]
MKWLYIIVSLWIAAAPAWTATAPAQAANGAIVLEWKGNVIARLASVSGGDIAYDTMLNQGTDGQLVPLERAPTTQPLVLEFPPEGIPAAAQKALHDVMLGKGINHSDGMAVELLDTNGKPVERIDVQYGTIAKSDFPGWDGDLSANPIHISIYGGFRRAPVTDGTPVTLPPQGRPLKKARLNIDGIPTNAVESMAGLSFTNPTARLSREGADQFDYQIFDDSIDPSKAKPVLMAVRLSQTNNSATALPLQPSATTRTTAPSAPADVAAPWQTWLASLRGGTTGGQKHAGVDYLDDAGTVALSLDLGPVIVARVDEDFLPLAARKTRVVLAGCHLPTFGAVAGNADAAGPIFGKLYPTNGPSVSVEVARWTVQRCCYKIGEETQVAAPEASQKLLVLELKLHNASDTAMSIDFNTLQIRLTDTDGKVVDGVGRLFN